MERVVRPRIADPRIPFRFNTNALESLNHVFKEVFNYHPERLPLAVDLAEKVAEKHEKLIMCAFVNQGDWELAPEVRNKFFVPLDQGHEHARPHKARPYCLVCEHEPRKDNIQD